MIDLSEARHVGWSARMDHRLVDLFAEARRGKADDECWPWPGTRTAGGYGHLQPKIAGKTVLVYIHALINQTPAGMVTRHRCDNPPCVNPRHLLSGSQRDNVHDAMARSSSFGRPSRLTELQKLEIRKDPRPVEVLANAYAVSVRTIYRAKAAR